MLIYEKNIYDKLVRSFVILFISISLIFTILYFTVFTRMEKSNAKEAHKEVVGEFSDLIEEGNALLSDMDFSYFVEGKGELIEDLYAYHRKYGVNFSLIAFDKDYTRISDFSIQNSMSRKAQDYIDIGLKFFESGDFYTYKSLSNNLDLISFKAYDKGFLVLFLDGDSIYRRLRQISSDFLICNKYERVLFAGDNLSDNLIKEDRQTYLINETSYKDFKIYSCNRRFFTREVFALIGGIFFLISVIYLLFIIIFTRKISLSISSSLGKLLDEVEDVSSGRLQVLSTDYEDETEYIAENINRLIENVKDLEKNNVSLQYEKKAGEFKTMESQFNPHFLYNTLDVISYEMYVDREVCQKIISNLSKILRYSINDLSFVSLEEDLVYLDLYMEIQKIKNEDDLNYSINLEEGLEKILVPKLFLQPLVENSLKYASKVREKVDIKVEIYSAGEKIIIDITDNGDPLQEEDLERINKKIVEKSKTSFLADDHHGLENSLKRLSVLYKDCQLQFIKSNEVKLRIDFEE